MPSRVCIHVLTCVSVSVWVCVCLVVVFTAFLIVVVVVAVVVHARLLRRLWGYLYLFCGMCVSRPNHPKSGKKKKQATTLAEATTRATTPTSKSTAYPMDMRRQRE